MTMQFKYIVNLSIFMTQKYLEIARSPQLHSRRLDLDRGKRRSFADHYLRLSRSALFDRILQIQLVYLAGQYGP